MAYTAGFAPQRAGPAPQQPNRYMSALSGPTPRTQTPSLGGTFGTAQPAPTPATAAGGAPYSYGQTGLTKSQVNTAYGGGNVREQAGALTSGANAQQQQQNQAGARNQFEDLLGQDPSKVLSSYVAGAMPQFMQQLQGIRANDVQRGISTGDLGTAYEGSLASAFQRNITSKAADLYGTQLGAAGQLYGQDSANALNSSNQYLGAVGDIQNQWLQQLMQGRAQNNAMLGGIIGSVGNVGAAFAGKP